MFPKLFYRFQEVSTVFLQISIYVTSLQRFSQCVRRDGEQSEPRWRAKRAALASEASCAVEASPVWLAISRSLSVEFACPLCTALQSLVHSFTFFDNAMNFTRFPFPC